MITTEKRTVESHENIRVELIAGNWYQPTYQALERLITKFGLNSPNYDRDDKPYVVFDWDNTSIINDIGEATFTYQIEHLQYKMSPAEFEEAVLKDIPKDEFSQEWHNLNGEPVNIEKISKDLRRNYEFLYNYMSGENQEQSLDEIKQTNEYQDFAAKIRYVYDAIGDSFSPAISYPWVTYLFTGMTSEEVQSLTRLAIDEGLAQDLGSKSWESPKD